MMKIFLSAAILVLLSVGCSDNTAGRYVPTGAGATVILDTRSGRILAYRHLHDQVYGWDIIAPPVDK